MERRGGEGQYAFQTPDEPGGQIRIRGVRLAALVWSIALFGALSGLTFGDQIAKLLGD